MSEMTNARAEGRGLLQAARYMPHRVEEALKEYKNLENRVARKAFADHWVGLWARDFDEAWPMLYELLALVEEEKLYADPRRVGPGAAGSEHGDKSTYASFADYFRDRVGRSFETWAELENTFKYAKTHKPELFAEGFERAQVVAHRAVALEGKTINSGQSPVVTGDNVTSNETGKGNSAEYLTRRIVRDHPDIAERMKAGEFKSVRAAALEAGIAPRTITVRLDDPDSVARSLRKHMHPDNIAELARLLAEEH